ncbi:MAG: hypothetical protein CVU90_02805 [Firmicutes bacterium HGW-Firmicutes-15]|nr:MAG: hypothetical protein CVU90_02805 [Firmicutes bacterium HGW-Firmicutes-15]
MRTVGLVSWESGTGQNTVAVNLAMGLARRSKRVILVNLNHNMRIFHWLRTGASEEELSFDQIYSSSSGVDFVYPVTGLELTLEKLAYDYAILNIGGDDTYFCEQGVRCSDLVVACTRLQSPVECHQLLDLQSSVKRYRQDDRGIDLLLPVQIHSGEWKINSQRLFELAEAFGEERIADLLPHCERIHDLFLQKHSVWNLSQPSIIDAFNRMLERVEQLT